MRRYSIVISIFAVIIAAMFFSAAKCADAQPDAVVFIDPGYPISWVQRGAAQEIAEFAKAIGFVSMDAVELEKWMKSAVDGGARGKLLVMAGDVVPRALVGETPTSPALIRKYLDAGGSVVWAADVPFYFVGEPRERISPSRGEKEKWDYQGGRGVLGIDTVGNWQGQSEAHASGLGAEWNLKSKWTSVRAVKPSDVTNVLAVDADGNASAWTKQFADGSLGFIRMWDSPINSFTDVMAEDLYKIASHVIPRLAEMKTGGDIYLFKPSDYRPLVRRAGDTLIREIIVSVFDSAPSADTSYRLKIERNGKTLRTIDVASGGNIFYKKNLEIPLLFPDQELSLVSVAGGAEKQLKRITLGESKFFCGLGTSAEPRINPIDLGHALVPEDSLLLATAQELKLDIWMEFPGDGGEHKLSLRAPITNKEGKMLLEFKTDATVPEGAVKSVQFGGPVKTLDPGKYLMKFAVLENGKEIYTEKRWVIIDGGQPANRGFGAYYTDIKYDGKVPIYDRNADKWSTAEWKDVWMRGPYSDIVVSFPNGNRFVFWRGSSNVPFWASWANIGLTYEWLEASWGRGGLVDCIEPLQDKKCRYSRPHIVASTPARAVINWRYAESDLDYTIADDEWAEENFYFYPDGFGVRNNNANVLPMTWHESNEMIILIPPAINPFDVFPPNAVRILSLDGTKSQDVTYPQPHAVWPEKTPTVFRINYSRKDKNTPILVSWKFKNFIQQYDGWKVDGRYVCPSYWGVHYPITRGYPTTRQEPPGWRERPGHASLITIDTEPFSQKRINPELEQIHWAWLIGNTDMPDKDLLEIARSWTNPQPIEILEGASSGNYDQFQRGYVLNSDGKDTVQVKFKGAGDQNVFNPVFIIKDFPYDSAEVTVDNVTPEEYKAARESDYRSDTLIVWIGRPVKDTAVIKIKKKE